ncbi:MAG: hypothetical protein JO316_10155 [Abitibacteriaceae bacterium]|nr:hypothetical protein [Abditibacteriaceae bacterium]
MLSQSAQRWIVLLGLALLAFLAAVFLPGCSGGSSGNNPTPRSVNNPFAGSYTGLLQLGAGQAGTVALNVPKLGAATGTLVINAAPSPVASSAVAATSAATSQATPSSPTPLPVLAAGSRASLTGYVDTISGAFSLNGKLAEAGTVLPVTISGTVPVGSGQNSTIVAKIGSSTFTGIISAPGGGGATPTPPAPTPTPSGGPPSGTFSGTLSEPSADLNLATTAPLEATAKAVGRLSDETLSASFSVGDGTSNDTPLRAVLLTISFNATPHAGTVVQLGTPGPLPGTPNKVQYLESVNADIKGYIATQGTLTITALNGNSLEFRLDGVRMVAGGFPAGQPKGSFTLNGTGKLQITRQ